MAKSNAERQAAYRERRKAGQLTLTDRLGAVEVHLEALERRVRDLESASTAEIATSFDPLPLADALADLRERVAEVTKPPIPMPEVEEP